MNMARQLQVNLTDESKAYGYTLCIWGSGAILFNAFGMPSTISILLYVFGAVLGFGILSLAVYRGFFVEIERPSQEELVVATMVHFVAALGTVFVAAAGITELQSVRFAFFIAGLNATVMYNVLMLAEVALYSQLWELEQALFRHL